MSHKCLRCGKIYQDNDSTILRGCTNCGSIFFLYMKTDQEAQQLEQLEQIESELQKKDTTFEEQLAKSLQEKKAEPIAAMEEVKYEVEMPMPAMSRKAEVNARKMKMRRPKFGIETIRVPREGVYEINLEGLLQKRPIIVLEKGKVYFVHLPSVFEKVRERSF